MELCFGKIKIMSNYNIDEIEKWNNNLQIIIKDILSIIIGSNIPSSDELVFDLLKNDSKLLKYLQLKKSPFQNSIETDRIYDKWLIDLWGRKLKYYIGSLEKGIIAYNDTNSLNEYSNKEKSKLDSVISNLVSCYTVQNGKESLLHSLNRRNDLNNHYHTYIDPHLFSALLIYKTKKQSLGKNGLKKLQVYLIKEIENAIDIDNQMIYVCDVSTLWWGVACLAEIEKEQFSLFKGKFIGFQGIADICKIIINSSKDHLKSPDYNIAKIEETPEIYNEYRTRLFVIKNSLAIISVVKYDVVYKLLIKNIIDNLNILMNNKDEINSHIYFVGLTSEVISSVLNQLNEEDINVSKTRGNEEEFERINQIKK